MIEINRCEIVGNELIIDVMIPNLEWYKDVEIGSIVIDSDETYSESGPSSTPLFEQEFDTLYQRMLDMQEEMVEEEEDDDEDGSVDTSDPIPDPEEEEEEEEENAVDPDDVDSETIFPGLYDESAGDPEMVEEEEDDDDEENAVDSDDVDDSTTLYDVSDDALTDIQMEDDDEDE